MADVTSILDIMRQMMTDEDMAADKDIIIDDNTMLAVIKSEQFSPVDWWWAAVRAEHMAEHMADDLGYDWKPTYYFIPKSDMMVHSSTTTVETLCEDENDIADTLLDVIAADLDDKERFLH